MKYHAASSMRTNLSMWSTVAFLTFRRRPKVCGLADIAETPTVSGTSSIIGALTLEICSASMVDKTILSIGAIGDGGFVSLDTDRKIA